MDRKLAIGIVLGFTIGFGCRALGIPVPAPPALVGALLVLAMSGGYAFTDRRLARHAVHHVDACGPRSGSGAP